MTGEMAATFFSRWIHVLSACALLGSTLYFVAIVPAGAHLPDEPSRQTILLKLRRRLKLIAHPSILLLLVSGGYNAWHNWPGYKRNIPVTHALFGTHLLLGLLIFTILLFALAGREPARPKRGWLRTSVIILFLTVAVASALKQAREYVRPSAASIAHAP